MLFAKELQTAKIYVSIQNQGIFMPSELFVRERKIALCDEHMLHG